MKCSHLRFRSTRTQLFYHNFKRLSRTFFKAFQPFSKLSAEALLLRSTPLSQQLSNYTTPKSACQELFSALFKLFRLFLTRSQPLSAAYSVYHIFRSLSRPFFELFSSSHSVFPNSLPIRYPVSPLSQQPWYLSTSAPVCQDPFFSIYR